MIALITAHWLACAWHFVALFEIEHFHADNWIETKGLLDASAYARYVASLYWAVTTILTVGYGDITPVSTNEQWFAIVAMAIGCGMFAYILNTIGYIVKNMYQEAGRKT